jgi:hypothetical protein
MKRLRVSTAVVAIVLAACAPAPRASPSGIVTGRLLLEGGPIGPDGRQPGKRPIQGTVQFTVGRHCLATARAGSSGTFSIRLPAGTYDVSGPCSQPLSVTVTPQRITRIALTCIVR